MQKSSLCHSSKADSYASSKSSQVSIRGVSSLQPACTSLFASCSPVATTAAEEVVHSKKHE